jgi:hypothetical protein
MADSDEEYMIVDEEEETVPKTKKEPTKIHNESIVISTSKGNKKPEGHDDSNSPW